MITSTYAALPGIDGTAALDPREHGLVLIEGGRAAGGARGPERTRARNVEPARLTVRQAALFLALGCGLVVALLAASAVSDSLSRGRVAAAVGALPVETVVVEEGDSLWSIAEERPCEGVSTSELVRWIEEQNGFSGGALVETTMADWLPGVVAAEMPASFAPEALRAQAVAARTYILQRVRGGAANHPEAGVCDQYTCCCARKDDAALREQWGADYTRNMARIRQAVTDTDGQYLTYGGQLIRAVFHASSAGATESSAALWSGDAPYLVSVSSPETAQDVPNYVSTAEIAADAVRTAVRDRYPDCVLGDDPGTWFGTPVLDDSGRVACIPVGSETLTGAQVRALFSLRSAAFSVAYGGGTFTFTVTGSGHGVGMSQYGANAMAKEGYSCEEILEHYFTGAQVVQWAG